VSLSSDILLIINLKFVLFIHNLLKFFKKIRYVFWLSSYRRIGRSMDAHRPRERKLLRCIIWRLRHGTAKSVKTRSRKSFQGFAKLSHFCIRYQSNAGTFEFLPTYLGLSLLKFFWTSSDYLHPLSSFTDIFWKNSKIRR